MKFWKQLNSISDWKQALQSSSDKPILVLKHSTRCSISVMALDRINRGWNESDEMLYTPYYLDLLAHRDISQTIAEDTGVEHQSPQVILIKAKESVHSETHQAIRLENFREKIRN